jgi:hypothetical protein
MKRKYLHVEITDGVLYIYADDRSHGGKPFSLNEMDNQCDAGMVEEGLHIKIPLKDFKNEIV